MADYDLYGGTPPHVHRDTSIDAAERILPEVTALASKVLWHIQRSFTGATCWEVEQALELAHQTASARIRELQLKGRIKDSGLRRKTGSGRKAIVWYPANDPPAEKGSNISAKDRIKMLEKEVAALRAQVRSLNRENNKLYRIIHKLRGE